MSAWADAMIREFGVQIFFSGARMLGMGVAIWLTVVVVNWHRDRDERRNVGEKERGIIAERTADRDYWRRRAEDAEVLAGERLAIIRASTAAMTHAAQQLRGAGEAKQVRTG